MNFTRVLYIIRYLNDGSLLSISEWQKTPMEEHTFVNLTEERHLAFPG